jgi:hypothetical protein
LLGSSLILATGSLGAEGFGLPDLMAAASLVSARQICLSPAPRTPPATALVPALQRHDLRVACVQGVTLGGRGLAAGRAEERGRAMDLAAGALANARQLGCSQVILDLGRAEIEEGEELVARLERMVERDGTAGRATDLREELIAARAKTEIPALDRLSRALWNLLRSEPEMRIALLTGSPVIGYPTRVMLEQLFEDLHAPRLSYWHDAGRVRVSELLGVEAEGAWLNSHAASLSGVFLADVQGTTRGLPPGVGSLDFHALRSHLPVRCLKVVDIAPGSGLAALKLSFDHLRSLNYD